MKIGIIGGGIGGLVSAVLFAKDGHDVRVYEKNKRVGGKLNFYEEKGYRFDTGPSLLTMPFLLERVFSYAGCQMQDYLELIKPEPICRYQYADGEIFNNYSSLPLTLKELDHLAPSDKSAYIEFLGHAAMLYQKNRRNVFIQSAYLSKRF